MIIKMRKNAGMLIIILAAVLVLAMIIPGLFSGSSSTTTSKYWRTTVAVVNGRKVTRLEYEREFINQFQLRSQLGTVRYDMLDQLRSTVMDLVVDKELVLAAAAAAKVNLSKEVIDAEVAKQKEQIAGSSQDNWTTFLNNWAFTESTFRTYVTENALYDSFLSISATYAAVSDADVQAEFAIRKARNSKLVLDDVKEEITNTLTYERQRDANSAYIKKLREQALADGKIEIKETRVLAYRAYAEGEYDKSISYYKTSLKDNEQDPYLWCSLAMAQAKKGTFEDAMISMGKAMELGEDFTIYLTRAEINAMQKLDDAAYADVESAVKLAGTNLSILQSINYVIED
ncbi:MAG TPA: SurA N-terminal domain-containing protein, partial [Bacillota bacterium]|nr:SurA N-terminal domain-containing protein [Bacillota bacterium]